jgi:CRISPR-associated DxTHG motif protein
MWCVGMFIIYPHMKSDITHSLNSLLVIAIKP